ncbi:MAG: hypothetical protein HQL11_00865 [Candidatus Omnitrophica bacterium]|nr:hypothetical protein [Candidatus Omnitrophota bacterium]
MRIFARTITLVAVLGLWGITAGVASAQAAEEPEPKAPVALPFAVYTDGGVSGNHYAPSGFMGDHGDLNIVQSWNDNPHSGTSCIRIVYSAEATEGAQWAGIYWQNPDGNWGARDQGFNLEGASRLVFWARGEKGGERIDKFRVGGIQGRFSDSTIAGFGPVALTTEWTRYEIDLTGKDLSSIIGGFMLVAKGQKNPEGFTIYLDDISFE